MAKLQDLQPMIESEGKTAKLFAASGHPKNYEKKDLTIYVYRDLARNIYRRGIAYKNAETSMDTVWTTIHTWDALFDIKDGIEATSYDWEIDK